ncbi:4'-phosphopantetheinyl transferase family protein [Rhodothermus bifroesti]|jgi:4'-phosphopantetheinyl transferase|uniref:4'-phosphopantetheinyl transferase superfamily protein n=1 Tax=Rhodothermus marinus TaxID=29549 RepID=A0A7V2B0M6_RHOMR|nr:4'-phosphopantetheinyl transferase superfamily protein [Rhodothermus bifroesti]GBD00640.1 4'-phosphopantetheinyl transferase sfp [bacterium HR18]
MSLPETIAYRWLRYDAAQEAAWRAWLSAEEQQRLERFRSFYRKRSFLTGRAAVRQLLAQQLGVTPGQVPLVAQPDEPLQVLGEDVYVSLAHADDWALAATAPYPIGVDLERLRPRSPELCRHVLHPEEYPLLETFGKTAAEAIVWLWALKEAALKGAGLGLRCWPRRLRLELVGATCGWVQLPNGQRWAVAAGLREGYVWAIAWPALGLDSLSNQHHVNHGIGHF